MALRKNSHPNSMDEDLEVARLELDLAHVLQARLDRLDFNERDSLSRAMDIFDKARVERQRVAEQLGVGDTTVSRWSSREIQPRAVAFRKAMLAEMRELMAEIVKDRSAKLRTLEAERPVGAGKTKPTPSPGP